MRSRLTRAEAYRALRKTGMRALDAWEMADGYTRFGAAAFWCGGSWLINMRIA